MTVYFGKTFKNKTCVPRQFPKLRTDFGAHVFCFVQHKRYNRKRSEQDNECQASNFIKTGILTAGTLLSHFRLRYSRN